MKSRKGKWLLDCELLGNRNWLIHLYICPVNIFLGPCSVLRAWGKVGNRTDKHCHPNEAYSLTYELTVK